MHTFDVHTTYITCVVVSNNHFRSLYYDGDGYILSRQLICVLLFVHALPEIKTKHAIRLRRTVLITISGSGVCYRILF